MYFLHKPLENLGDSIPLSFYVHGVTTVRCHSNLRFGNMRKELALLKVVGANYCRQENGGNKVSTSVKQYGQDEVIGATRYNVGRNYITSNHLIQDCHHL